MLNWSNFNVWPIRFLQNEGPCSPFLKLTIKKLPMSFGSKKEMAFKTCPQGYANYAFSAPVNRQSIDM